MTLVGYRKRGKQGARLTVAHATEYYHAMDVAWCVPLAIDDKGSVFGATNVGAFVSTVVSF